MPDHPPGREDGDAKHDGRFHQFGRPHAQPRDCPEGADGYPSGEPTGGPRQHVLAMTIVRAREGGRSERSLWGEETARFNLREAFFQREELRDFPPLPRMPEVGQVEAAVAGVLKSGELGLEKG